MELVMRTIDLSAGGREHSQNRKHAGPFPGHKSEEEDIDHVLYLVSLKKGEPHKPLLDPIHALYLTRL